MYKEQREQESQNHQCAMAHYLADRDFRIFPVSYPVFGESGEVACSCGSTDCRSIGKHPAITGWQERATNDHEEVAKFWESFEGTNIGILTGDGLVVIDVDKKSGGFDSLESLFGEYGPFPDTVTVNTGGGGRHYYFHCGKGTVKCRTSGLGRGIDIRGDGGFVVGPGSTHKSGDCYDFAEGLNPDDIGIAELPDWVFDIISAKAVLADTGGSDDMYEEGTRNTTLTSIAGSLRAKGMDSDEIYSELLAVNGERCTPPLPEDEVRTIAESVSRYQANVVPFRTPAGITAREERYLPLTDMGNAERLVRRYGKLIRFRTDTNKWMVYEDGVWKIDDELAVNRYAAKTVRSIKEEINIPGLSYDDIKKIEEHEKRSESSGKLDAVMRLARNEPDIAVTFDAFDRDNWLFNVANGTVDLKTGKLLPHNSEDMFSKISDICYDEAAGCPMFENFLDQIFQGNRELTDFIQTLVGYSMTGFTSESIMAIFYGTGANGKSTLMNILGDLFGDYWKTASANTFLAKRNDGQTNDLAALVGARLVGTSETEHGKYLSEALVKSVTGGDPITARFLFHEFFTFVPTFQIIMATNYKPLIKGTDNAIWRRLRLVPFNLQLPRDKQDLRLGEKLKEELPGILNWAIKGCLRWQKDGLVCPDVVMRATDTYKSEMNSLAQFIDAECVRGKDVSCGAGLLFRRYKQWASENGEQELNTRDFKQEMERLDFAQRRNKDGKFWNGITLKDSPSELLKEAMQHEED